MAAAAVVAAMLVLVQYAERQTAAGLLMLALLVVAGFESSAYVGGVTFAVAAVVATPILLLGMPASRRVAFAAGLAAAAVLTLCIAAPFIRDQLTTVAARGAGNPIGVKPFEVLGEMVPAQWRRLLDLPAYWLVLLPIEFPACFVAGTIALIAAWRAGSDGIAIAVLGALAAVGLIISWLLVGGLGENNDLALRAILPAALVLIAAAAAGMALPHWRAAIVATALAGLVLSLPDTVRMARSNFVGDPAPDARVFAQSPDLWAAVRRYAGPDARVANNPLYLHDLTPWPVNVSWALLADRSSCFAGREMALAFASLPAARREAIDAQFIRVFAGEAQPGDVAALAQTYDCEVAVVVPQDGAWTRDPFAASPDYKLVESRDDRWRIYRRTSENVAPR
jgi:hypothetical protein